MSEPAVPRELAQAVLAWQHRNPLARRLAEGDVGGIGLVHLPLAADQTPLFSPKPFIPGLSMGRVLKFLAAHGFDVRPGEADWPQRALDPAVPGESSTAEALSRWLITVAVPDARGRAVRLLIGRSYTDGRGRAHTPVIGRRPLSAWRSLLAGLLAAGLALALAAVWTGRVAPGAGAPASAASRASAPASEAAASMPAGPGQAATEVGLSAASSASTATSGSDSASATGAAAAAASASAAATATLPASAPASPAGPPAASAAPAAPAAAARSWALVSAPTWRRAELERSQRRLPRWVLARNSGLQAEVMETPQGWVLTIWPLVSVEQAEGLAATLRGQGLPMVLIDF